MSTLKGVGVSPRTWRRCAGSEIRCIRVHTVGIFSQSSCERTPGRRRGYSVASGNIELLRGVHVTSVRPALWQIGQSIAVLGLLAGVAGQAGANTIMISYSGTGPGSLSMGLGSFSFADGLSTVNLSDLTAFSFSQSFNVGDSVVPEFRYGLGDLTAFSATLSAGQILTTLSLETGNVLGNPATYSHGRAFAPQAFKVTSLATGGASTLNLNIDTTITTGTVTQVSAVPEPSTPDHVRPRWPDRPRLRRATRFGRRKAKRDIRVSTTVRS